MDGSTDVEPLSAAFASVGAPLDVVRLGGEEQSHKVYGASLLLLRPDLHVAWRAEELPADATALMLLVTGNVNLRPSQ